ncbi:hypothetical protein ACPFP2_22005 [Micromonospora citrea]|uniref:hypothetical protein n=1 Tax=Micromonospora citrea TaxID=47855 RepID=UPI003C45DD0B
MRRKLVPVAALAMVCLLTVSACGSGGSTRKRSRSTDRAPAAAPGTKKDRDVDATLPAATPGPTASRRRDVRLGCDDLEDAQVGSRTVRYRGLAQPVTLDDGTWRGRDGTTVTLQQACGVGDLDGDGVADVVGAVALNGGGSGTFFTLVAWRGGGGEPVFRALADLGDRTPLERISMAGRKATVVWLTRSAGRSLAELNVRRTSVYQLSGAKLVEVSHTDQPYAP